MRAAPAPFRVVRGTVVAAVALLLAVAAHGAASGGSVELGSLGVPTGLLVLAGCVVASARAWTLPRLLLVLAGVQVVAHLSLLLGTPSGSVDPRLAGLASAAHQHAHAHAATLAPTMLAAHGVAVLLSAILLARLDVAVTVLWHLVRRLLLPVQPAGVRLPAVARVLVEALRRVGTAALLTTVAPRRGPPAALARA